MMRVIWTAVKEVIIALTAVVVCSAFAVFVTVVLSELLEWIGWIVTNS